MADIIPINGDPHEQVQRLLPWYAKGKLEPGERRMVAAHLDACAQCRAELEFDRALGAEIPATPAADADRDWTALQARLAVRARPQVRPYRAALSTLMRRRVALGWAVCAQAAVLALTAGTMWLAAPATQPLYHALSTPSAEDAGNLIVMFRPDMTEQQLRRILRVNGARLAGGPTVSDAYLLRVAPDRREAVLARLRANHDVVLAQPLDDDRR